MGNRLTTEQKLARKTPALRRIIEATLAAVPTLPDSYAYDRDQLLPIEIDTLLDPQIKGTTGITARETLRKIYDVLSLAATNHSTREIEAAIEELQRELGYGSHRRP